MNEQFDSEFKYYMREKGINFDPNLFDLKFNPPQNFASYRQAEMDTARVSTYSTISAIPHMSKRFALKRFMGLTQEEIAENERLWKEENGLNKEALNAASELRSAGITSSGASSDMEGLEGMSDAPEGMDDASMAEGGEAAPGGDMPAGAPPAPGA
jgi:hypothetical protein